MFQSPLNIKHKSGHLFTLDPQLFLEEVDADGFLVALGERAPTISEQSKFQTKEKNIEAILLKAPPLDHARLSHSSVAHDQHLWKVQMKHLLGHPPCKLDDT